MGFCLHNNAAVAALAAQAAGAKKVLIVDWVMSLLTALDTFFFFLLTAFDAFCCQSLFFAFDQ